MTNAAELYDEDVYAWTQNQAASLRLLAKQCRSGPLDLENLSEEVEDLGRAARNTCPRQIELPDLAKAAHRAAVLELLEQDSDAIAGEMPTMPAYTIENLLHDGWLPVARVRSSHLSAP